MSKGDPIPTRFDEAEDTAINELQRRTGLSAAEIVRRAVRLLKKRYDEVGSVGFIVEELAPRIAETTEPPKTRVLRTSRPVKYTGGKKKWAGGKKPAARTAR